MRVITGIIVVLLAGCALTPYECRTVGVDVPDSAEKTGTIVSEQTGTPAEVKAKCMKPFTNDDKGCAIPVGEHQYKLWYIADGNIRDHERCHAKFETKAHCVHNDSRRGIK